MIDSVEVKKDTPVFQSKQETLSNHNADVAVNKPEIKKKVKFFMVPLHSNITIKKNVSNTISNSDDAAASVSLPANQNQSYKKDTSEAFNESNKQTVTKDIESLYKPNNANEFVGKVVDINSQPISGAYVNIANQKNATVTDNNGMFKLFAPRADSIIKINVSSVGFETTKAILISDNDIADNTINLRSNTSSLNEVVVTGLGRKIKADAKNIASEETLKNAEPVIGWKKYKEYLYKNKRLSGDSIGLKIIEIVSFTIKKNGKLSNFNIEQSYDDDFDDEAIRLIKNGPAWKLLKNKKARATITIEF